MIEKKNYPQKKKQHYPSNQNIANPNIINNKPRYQKGHQNQFVNAFRKTETYYKDKTVIVTESFNMVDFKVTYQGEEKKESFILDTLNTLVFQKLNFKLLTISI